MALAAGTRLGQYEVVGPLGAGGMGEVYKARDVRLGRDVALKILPDTFTRDTERLARFRREAQVLAALNHPNIAAIYGFDEAGGSQFLVLELVDGDTLARRLAEGPVSVEESLAIAGQVAAALECAHEKGIIHRDLKPGNIGLTRDGVIKVLDFGLAKATLETGADVGSPTITSAAQSTALGVILGTAAYMSPEQARGQQTDRRTDIWSFGCVLYEMVTGRRAFGGDNISDTIAAVLTGTPDWSRVPARVLPLIRQCLERDPKRRLRDLGDRHLMLDGLASPPSRPTGHAGWFVAAGLAVALAAAIVLLWPKAVDRPLIRLDLDLGSEAPMSALWNAAISPDGTRLVFRARDANGRFILATRRLDESKVTLLAGSQGADDPFFSPDGQWVAFFKGSQLMKMPVLGGTPVVVCDSSIPRGGSWGDDGTIIAALSNNTGLSRVSADGGPPKLLTAVGPADPTHRWPQVLPGSRAVIFTANTPTLNSYEDATIDVLMLESGQRRTLWRGGYFGRYLPTAGSRGHLVFASHGQLRSVPFDPDRLEISGTPSALIDDLATDPGSGAGYFDFSRTGSFLYQPGIGLRPWVVTWLDATGQTAPLLQKPALYYSPRFSPDGKRLAVGIDGGKGADLFVYDLQKQSMSQLTFTSRMSADPVWTPDGAHLVFRSAYATEPGLWWLRAEGGGSPERLLDVDLADLGPNSLSHDGRTLVFARARPSPAQLFTAALDLTDPDRPKTATPVPLFPSSSNQTRPAFSPDDRFVAYVSDESGALEVYVRSLTGSPSGKWRVSTGGGNAPVWSNDRRSLFYTSANRVMQVEYTTGGGTFRPEPPRLWSSTRIFGRSGFTNYDLAPDGKRVAIFQTATPEAEEDRPRVTLLLNFFDEIRRRR
jgi:serine/threonine-protein kinase